MKNNILTLIFLLGTFSVFSQDVRFGFTASPTFSFSSVDPSTNNPKFSDETSAKLGLNYGVLLDYDVNGDDRYYIHSGLMLQHTGYNFSTDSGIGGVAKDYEVNANYLEIPAVLKLKTNEIGYLRYFGQFGVNNDIKISEKVKEPTDVDSDLLNSYNAGLNIGAGVEYEISGDTTAVGGLYYVNGFSKVIDNSLGILKQNQLGIRLGVYF